MSTRRDLVEAYHRGLVGLETAKERRSRNTKMEKQYSEDSADVGTLNFPCILLHPEPTQLLDYRNAFPAPLNH
jgi:hypothetical protein